MRCPRCKIILDAIRTRSHYGQSIVLDQCKECGGVWVDENELFQIHRGEARMIESKPLPKLKKYIYSKGPIQCPKHKVPMVKFQDPNFPTSVNVGKCPVCSNFWFERGDLTQWQESVIRRWPNDEKQGVGREKE